MASLLEQGYAMRLSVGVEPHNVPLDQFNFLKPIRFSYLDRKAICTFSHVVDYTRDIVISNDVAGLNRIPGFVLVFDPDSKDGYMYLKIDTLSASTTTVYYLWTGNKNAVAEGVDDTYGRNNVFNSDMIAYWHFAESSGVFGNIATNDVLTWDNGANVRPTVVQGDDLQFSALHFNDGVTTNRMEANAQLVTGSFHITFNFKTSQAFQSGSQWYQGKPIIDSDIGGSADDWGISFLGNGIALGIGNPDTTMIGGTVNDDVMHLIGVDWDSGTGAAYITVDGVVVDTDTLTSGARTATDTFMGATGVGAMDFIIAELEIMDVSKPLDGGIAGYDVAKYNTFTRGRFTDKPKAGFYVGTHNYSESIVDTQLTTTGLKTISTPGETRIPVGVEIVMTSRDSTPAVGSPLKFGEYIVGGDTIMGYGFAVTDGVLAQSVTLKSDSLIMVLPKDGNDYSHWVNATLVRFVPGGFAIFVNGITSNVQVFCKFLYQVSVTIGFAAPTTTTFSMVGLGFDPNFIKFFNFRHGYTGNEQNAYFSKGYCDEDLNQACISQQCKDFDFQLNSYTSNNSVAAVYDSDGVLDSTVAVTSFSSEAVNFALTGIVTGGFLTFVGLVFKLPPGHSFVGTDTNKDFNQTYKIPIPFKALSFEIVTSPVNTINTDNSNNGKAFTAGICFGVGLNIASNTLSYAVMDGGLGTADSGNANEEDFITVSEDLGKEATAVLNNISSDGITFDWGIGANSDSIFIFAAIKVGAAGQGPLLNGFRNRLLKGVN